MTKEKEDKQSQEAFDLGTVFLNFCVENKIDENTAQAALGSAWYRLCLGMRFDLKTFKEMTDGMYHLYTEDYEKPN